MKAKDIKTFLIDASKAAADVAGEEWRMTDDEAARIAAPAARLLSRLSPAVIEKGQKLMDPLALMGAVLMYAVPRLLGVSKGDRKLAIIKGGRDKGQAPGPGSKDGAGLDADRQAVAPADSKGGRDGRPPGPGSSEPGRGAVPVPVPEHIAGLLGE